MRIKNDRINTTATLIMPLVHDQIYFAGRRTHDQQAVRQAVDNILEAVMIEVWRRPLFMIESASPLVQYIYSNLYDARRTDELGREFIRLNLFPSGDQDILLLPLYHKDGHPDVYQVFKISQSSILPTSDSDRTHIGYLRHVNTGPDGDLVFDAYVDYLIDIQTTDIYEALLFLLYA